MTQPGPPEDRFPRRLAIRRVLARATVLFEQIWPVAWPPLGVFGLFAIFALTDAFRFMPPWLHLMVLLTSVVAACWFGWRGARGLIWPDARAGERRLEQASGLRHRPLSTLADRPAGDDALSRALWQVHLARTAARIGQLRVGLPRPGLAARDRHALRAGLIVALTAAVVIAGPDAASRLNAGLWPDFSATGHEPDIQIRGWVTPPAYTRLAPIFLKTDGQPVAVPAGSHLTLNVSGTSTPPGLEFAGAAGKMQMLDATSFQAEHDLLEPGRLALRVAGRDPMGWDFRVIPDRPPTASWPEPPGPARLASERAASERAAPRHNVRLPWQVSDDYGVVSLRAELVLAARPGAPAVVVPIPLAGGTPAAARGVAHPDLVAHPWAGLAVTARLVARDALDQAGLSPEAVFTLPERIFEHPVARQLIAVRKQLSVTPDDRPGAISGLRGLLGAPELFVGDYGAWLNLSAIASLLARDKQATAVDAAQARLWDLALYFEEGGTGRTGRNLEAARRAAHEAIEQARRSPEDQAKREALERKLAELQEAIRQHLDAMREEAKRELSEIPAEIDRLDQQEMDRLAEAAREAAREGKPDEAKDRLAELERMLEEMRNAQIGSDASEQRNAERRQRGRQQMGVVQDLIAREGQVLDHAQSRGLPPLDARGRSRPPQPEPSPDGQTEQRQQDRAAQQALRRALGEMMQQVGDLTGKIPPSLNDADLAMRDATVALAQSRDSATARAAQQAIAALQRGGREMGQEMARQFGRPRPGAQPGEDDDGDGDPGDMGFSLRDGQSDQMGGWRGGHHGRNRMGEARDPLGRRLGQGTGGAEDSDEVAVPEEMERQRTQNLQQELRRRGGERFRPREELDYIDRLLRRF